MKIPAFQSPLAPFMKELVETRYALGYGATASLAYLLAHFDRFLVSRGHREQSLTRQIVEDWASSGPPIKPITRANRIKAVRVLAKFIVQTQPCYVPGLAWRQRRDSGFRPHIYTPAQIQALLAEAAKLDVPGSLVPRTYVTLFALLSCTGLRISEALALELRDVDLEEGVLWIRESKFHKSRMVPLHPTAVSGLKQYREARNSKGLRRDPEAPFFVSKWLRPFASFKSITKTFLDIARRAGIRKQTGVPGPRLHDLRHAFALSRLLAWYRDGQDVQARMLLLSTYLGHVRLASTQVYLNITAELLQEAARRFKAPAIPPAPTQGAI